MIKGLINVFGISLNEHVKRNIFNSEDFLKRELIILSLGDMGIYIPLFLHHIILKYKQGQLLCRLISKMFYY